MHYRHDEYFARGENAVAGRGDGAVGALTDHLSLYELCVLASDDHLSGGRDEDVARREHNVLAERRVRSDLRLEERSLAAVHACARVAPDRSVLLTKVNSVTY